MGVPLSDGWTAPRHAAGVDLITLADARERTLAAHRQVLDGIDPIGAKKTALAAARLEAAKALDLCRNSDAYYDDRSYIVTTKMRVAGGFTIGVFDKAGTATDPQWVDDRML